MGLIDKVKQQAEQAVGLAQQGMSQGQAKFEEVQAKRQAQTLLRNLGTAYYAQQRQGGSEEAVTAALAAMDQHVAAHPPGGSGAAAEDVDQTGQSADADANADADAAEDQGPAASAALPADGASGPGGNA